MISKLESDGQQSLKTILEIHKPTSDLNQDLASLINAEHLRLDPNETTWSRYITASSKIVDSWGRPLQIRWREDLIGTNYISLKLSIDSPIIIWSLGPNGENNYGLGDDVVWKGQQKKN